MKGQRMRSYLSYMLATGLILLPLGGCLQTKVIDNLDYITAVAYDWENEKYIRGTVAVPFYLPDRSVKNATYQEVTQLSKEMREKMNKLTPNPLVSGKLEVGLFGTEMARKKGIMDVLDSWQRDPFIGRRAYLAVVDGNAGDLLLKAIKKKEIGESIAKLIQHNIEHGRIPDTNFHHFINVYYRENGDPWLPLLTLEQRKPMLKGMALFKKGKMKGKIETIQEMAIFTFMHWDRTESTGVKFVTKKGVMGFLRVTEIHRKIKVVQSGNMPSVHVKLDIHGNLEEIHGVRQATDKVIPELEHLVEKELQYQGQKLIQKLQRWNVDPLGYSEAARIHDRHFDAKAWSKQYPHIKVKITCRVHIDEYGIVD
ncbi:Ger(x)C family spore germination protein [Marininema halotolerans]|uniref:Spore germination protein n=1 Tax=Marininema halotolerans TaxID=1155944 RepID=A0A1I6Q3T8_9BACL|nr:Ger(x)C family spore germination protein [Marininema halotolerans]SFS47159.1 spore germination protein [Marininema halotolerans]